MSLFTSNVVEALFAPEKRRQNEVIYNVNQTNKRLRSLHDDGFLFRGQFYRPSTGTLHIAAKGDPKSTLHSSLIELMEQWVKDSKMLKEDTTIIGQTLHVLLSKCILVQDYRDALPECLIPLVECLSGIQRHREVAYTLMDNQRAYLRFQKLLPKIEFYAATRFIY